MIHSSQQRCSSPFIYLIRQAAEADVTGGSTSAGVLAGVAPTRAALALLDTAALPFASLWANQA